MNRHFFLFLFLTAFSFHNAGKSFAQTFPFSSGNIPMCDTVFFHANVFGISILQPPGTGFGSTLLGVEINITSNHPQTIKVTLTSPAGTDLLLVEFLGAGGINYSQTNFTYTGSPSILTGSAPFTGNWTAQGGSLSIFDGEDPNGTWTITIIDTACTNIPIGGTGFGPWTPGYFNGSASADGGIGFGGSAGPLPVSLIGLNAQQEGETVKIEWTTASEINNHYFEIERTTDHTNYTLIGSVLGNGTTFNTNRYILTDENPVAGIQYYRLKQVDYDGRTEYYGPLSVNFKKADEFVIISATINESGQIQLTYTNSVSEKLSLLISDASGRPVYSCRNIDSAPGINHLSVDFNGSSGIYILHLIGGTRSESVKIFYH